MPTPQDGEAHFPYLVLGFVFLSIAFAWLYAKGVEDKPWIGQGLRFGFVTWFFGVSGFLTYYAVQPLPASLVCKQIGFEFVDFLLLGIVVACVYRKS